MLLKASYYFYRPDPSNFKSIFFWNNLFFDTMNPQRVLQHVHSNKLKTRKKIAEKISNYNKWNGWFILFSFTLFETKSE